jgi:uncharacterized protein (TIGR03067 family)
MRLSLIVPLLCGLLVAADDAKKDAKADRDKLQGAWRLTSGPGGATEARLVIEGDKYSFKAGEQEERGTLKLDPSKTPKTIDLQITEGQDKGKSQVGIYELQGDTFKLSVAPAGETERPTSLDAKDNSLIFVFKRDKP